MKLIIVQRPIAPSSEPHAGPLAAAAALARTAPAAPTLIGDAPALAALLARLGAAGHALPATDEAVWAELAEPEPGNWEIERKYLLRAVPEHARGAEFREVEQGWLPGERVRERLRRTRGPGGERYWRAIKAGSGIRRIEVEEEPTPELFAALWPLTAGRRVTKRRYLVPEGDLTWEIDDFTDRDLVLAEVELPTIDTEVVIPEWLRPHVVREVTGESQYVNYRLAK